MLTRAFGELYEVKEERPFHCKSKDRYARAEGERYELKERKLV